MERAAIAAEIHDGLLPYLYAAAAKLSAIQRAHRDVAPDVGRDDDRCSEQLADAAEWIDRSREVARELMNGITYPPLALTDPLSAAKAFLDQFTGQSTGSGTAPSSDPPSSPLIHWRWTGNRSPLAGRLDEPSAIAIYRLTTEFVRNAAKHADAETIVISAVIDDELATVRIEDDGCGFDPEQLDSSTPHGLTLASHRAEAGGVEIQLESHQASQGQQPSGTQITLQTRLPGNAESQQHPSSDHPTQAQQQASQ
ncbi:sensor histidine kinase [Allorhodopirellula solitaria]|nr:ATP-binding protein [Allorhodopirellula solitaria]